MGFGRMIVHDIYDFVSNFDHSYQPIIHDFTWSLPIVTVTLYLLFVKYGPIFMAKRKKMDLSAALRYWNLFLAILSVAMFLGMAPPCFTFLLERGAVEFICLPGMELFHGSQMFWVYLFALSKYIELIDTAFLVLRQRTVTFLHYYHHTTVLLYTWFSMHTLPGGAGYVFSVTNSAVHSIMYWYYYRSACGKTPSWGQVVTVVQLFQMVVGVAVSGAWSIFYFTGTMCNCGFPLSFIVASVALYGSYFILFLQFYLNRYLSKR